MIAVIMAGGKGTRISSITKDEIPKPMVKVLGKPIIEWQIDRIKENEITDVIIVVGHLGHKIIEHFGDGKKFGMNIKYVIEKESLGTAGSFYYLKDYLGQEDYFLLVYGDVIFDIDIKRMERYHIEKHSIATLFAHPNSHPYDSDLVITDENKKIIRFDLKSSIREYWYDNCVNAGFYIVDKSIVESVNEPRKIDFEKDILRNLADSGKDIYAYISPEFIKDVGTIDRIEKVVLEIEKGVVKQRNLRNNQKCIFIDRDGTINKHKGLVYKEDDFELEEFTIDAIKLINESGYLCIVITNQPVVARGLCDIKDVETIHNKMKTILGRAGVYVDDIVFCPHHPDRGYPEENKLYKIDCTCRKPNIGMIKDCERKFNIALTESWMIGDTTIDIKTGNNAGMKTVLVLTGEAGGDKKYDVQPDITCNNLLESVQAILKEDSAWTTKIK